MNIYIRENISYVRVSVQNTQTKGHVCASLRSRCFKFAAVPRVSSVSGRRHSNSWYEPPSPSSPKDELYAKPSVTATDRDRKPGEGGALLGHVPPLGPAHLVTPPPGLVRYQSPVGE